MLQDFNYRKRKKEEKKKETPGEGKEKNLFRIIMAALF